MDGVDFMLDSIIKRGLKDCLYPFLVMDREAPGEFFLCNFSGYAWRFAISRIISRSILLISSLSDSIGIVPICSSLKV